MLYSESDKKPVTRQLIRRIVIMLVLALIPNAAALVVMLTVRIQWLSILLGCFGCALAIFYWGLCCQPLVAYARYLNEIIGGRSHAFTGELTEIAQDSVRESVPCKTLFFRDDAGDEQRLCYYDLVKYTEGCVRTGCRYHVTVHGQSIIAIIPE